jgi:hypothetical protein
MHLVGEASENGLTALKKEKSPPWQEFEMEWGGQVIEKKNYTNRWYSPLLYKGKE